MWKRFLGFSALVTFLAVPLAALGQTGLDVQVQAPQIAAPVRGSLAGQLASVAFGPGDVSRGAFNLPSPFKVSDDRGPLLASVFPSYSLDQGLSEWGMGWGVNLSITRWRPAGELDYATDDLTGPWGHMVRGTDGNWYPVGLSTHVRVKPVAGGFTAFLPDGSQWHFGGTATVTTPAGSYSWNLTEVDSVVGQRTQLTWRANLSGRLFLMSVEWGGAGATFGYHLDFTYGTLASPLVETRSGVPLTLDRRVTQVAFATKDGAGALHPRWHYVLGYTSRGVGIAYYLTQVQQLFASGATPPPTLYTYNYPADANVAAAVRPIPKFDPVLTAYTGWIAYPSNSSSVDLGEDGLMDLEAASDNTLIVQTSAGFSYQPLAPPPAGWDSACRAGISNPNNTPRQLAYMQPSDSAPRVLAALYNQNTQMTGVKVCSREGVLLNETAVKYSWEASPNVRLVDVNRDRRPDLIQAYFGGYAYAPNLSTSGGYAWGPAQLRTLDMQFSPEATWVHDFNGDGVPDLVVRTGDFLVVYLGLANFKFQQQGINYTFADSSGALINLTGREITFLDANNDGMTDVLLSEPGAAYLMLNNGTQFIWQPISALGVVALDVSLPLFNDFEGTGNAEVFMEKGGHAYSLALNAPGTGLMRSADDGHGTVLSFDYTRGPVTSGLRHRPAVLNHLTSTEVGAGAVTTGFAYAAPVLHSLGRFLLGYNAVQSQGPLVTQSLQFLNEDRYSGVPLASSSHDVSSPQTDAFDVRTYVESGLAGISWKRLAVEEKGTRDTTGTGVKRSSTTEYLTYWGGVCPQTLRATSSHGVLATTVQYVLPPAFASSLSCLHTDVTQVGTHPNAALDFHQEVKAVRNAAGQITSAEAEGPAGPLPLESVTYNLDGTVHTVTRPGQGTVTLGYAPGPLLTSVTSAVGVTIAVTARDAITDAILFLSTTRSGTPYLQSFTYDSEERLRSRWDNLGHASAAQPNETYSFREGTQILPAGTSITKLVDGQANVTQQQIWLETAAGEPVSTATLIPEGWTFNSVTARNRNAAETTRFQRPGLSATASPLALTYSALFTGAQQVGDVRASSGGLDVSDTELLQTGVTRTVNETQTLGSAGLLQASLENNTWRTVATLDEDKRRVAFQDEGGAVYSYTYDAMSRLRVVALPSGATHVAQYDGYGRISRVQRSEIATIDYSFDTSNGLLTRRLFSSPAGAAIRSVAFGYDLAGRTLTATHKDELSGASQTFNYYYDGATPENPSLQNAKGLVTAIAGNGYVKRMLYRADGSLQQRQLQLTGWRSLTSSLVYYDDGTLHGRTTSLAGANGAVLSTAAYAYARDAFGRQSTESLNGSLLATLGYDANGQPQKATYPAGSTASLSYDALTRTRIGLGQHSSTVNSSSQIQLNARGFENSESIGVNALTLNRQFTYANAGYLTGSSDAQASYAYGYDAFGLPNLVVTNGAPRPVRRSGSSLTAGTSTYTFDGLGRTTSRDGLAFVFGPNGQVAKATKGALAWTFLYDEEGKRIAKLSGGQFFAAFPEEGYLDAVGLTEPVTLGGSLVGVVQAGSFQLVPADVRGSVLAEADGTPRIASPFGARAVHPALAAAVDYVRKGYDADLGVVRMGVRDYDAAINRFLTPDPLYLEKLELSVGGRSDANLYGYAQNDPVRYVDPTGTTIVDAIFIATDVAQFAQEPSWVNGGWLALDVAATVFEVVPGRAEIKVAAKIVEGVKALVGSLKNALRVGEVAHEARGVAKLETAARVEIDLAEKGQKLYRQGTFADKASGWNGNYVRGRQWAAESPLSAKDYAKRYGLPAENTGRPDWVVKGRVEGEFSTRPAPASHNSPVNTGGGHEVTPADPGKVQLDWFHMPD